MFLVYAVSRMPFHLHRFELHALERGFLLISVIPVVSVIGSDKSVLLNRDPRFLRLSSERAMSTTSQQQDVSVLSAAKNGLVYLTPNDWALIVDKAVRMQFKAGDTIVHKGRRTNGVYLLLKGTAQVQIPSHATSLGVSAGEVCGEISFLDELPATADVVAKEVVQAYYLDRPTLLTLFELFPHLGSRFYHSLAAILSRRLRELIGPALPPGPVSLPKKD